MMHKKILLLLSLSGINTLAHADVNANMDQLQTEINTLNAKLNQENISTDLIGLDTETPFGAMPKVEMPLSILAAKAELSHPLVFGGELEVDAENTSGDNIALKGGGSYQNGSNISLSRAYLFTMANLNDMTTFLVNFKNNLPSQNVTVERAFLLFGNLNKTPFSLTLGPTYLPFGTFSGNAASGLWFNALTTNLFRASLTNQIIANYANSWFMTNAGIYENSALGSQSADYLFNSELHNTWNNINMSMGAGFLSDVRGSSAQLGSAYNLQGAGTSGQPLTGGTNPAYDINASIGPSYFSLLGEFVSTTQGAEELGQSVGPMNAWMLGEQSNFKIYGVPTAFQVSYSASTNMSQVPMSFGGNIGGNLKTASGIQHQWLSSITGELWKNVYIGPEFLAASLYNGQHSYSTTLDVNAYF